MPRGRKVSPELIVVALRQIEVQLAQAWPKLARRPASPGGTDTCWRERGRHGRERLGVGQRCIRLGSAHHGRLVVVRPGAGASGWGTVETS